MRPLLLLTFLFICAAVHAAEKPNIILIMGDDMGYSDIGCYGSEINTPNLDALAQGGVRFSQFYNTARCCPTRASLLTGLYPHQAGIGHMMDDKGLDGYRGELSRDSVTIAEALKPAGYRTYMAGKWHVTQKVHPQGAQDKTNWPLQRGFDRFYGTIHGAGSFYDPNSLTRDNELISAYADAEYQPKEYYYTDAIADNASRFVADHAKDHQDKPFFMYVAMTAAHWPMHAKPADIAKYKGKYDAGYDAIRAARVEKMKKLGLLPDNWQVAAQKGGAWSEVENREFEIRCMEVYAAMVDSMDQAIGRLVAELKEQGQYDNTLILFFQDNGGCAEPMGRKGPFIPRADKPTRPAMAATDLQPDMIPKQTRDGYPMRQGYGVLPGPADTYIGYGEAWANVSNTPFREYKHWVHEGGISTPLVAHWPKGIPTARHNMLESQPSHLIDLMATCLDLAGATYPAEHAGQKITPMEGVSLKPALAGQGMGRKEPIFFEHEGNRAVRDGQWKLVAKGAQGAWELYDMTADRTEQNDLAASQPERVKSMSAQWQTWAKRAQVIPWIWGLPHGDPLPNKQGKKGKNAKKKN
ncbi:arylsulfatase [Prosthecobacter sp. SYSU 5D2]|uniref:arylsulfatase n=1 Tax=Prosthecobacter sp. SYSU 5D2 TaxID=3134134 RepID=UPI0031FE5022